MRPLILSLLAVALGAGAASGQTRCSEECLFMVRETVRAAADRHEFPLSEVLVDTTRSGYRHPSVALGPGEDARLVSHGEFAALANELGIRLRITRSRERAPSVSR